MADIKISQLGAAIAVGDTDLVPIVSGGNTLKATAAQVKEHSIGNTNISSIGDGSVTGAINALNTDKQPKTLDTPLTIGGVSKTTVEAALGGLVSENQTLANNITDTQKIIAPVENGTNYSKTYVQYERFVRNNELYKVTAASVGTSDNIQVNVNCKLVNDVESYEAVDYLDWGVKIRVIRNDRTCILEGIYDNSSVDLTQNTATALGNLKESLRPTMNHFFSVCIVNFSGAFKGYARISVGQDGSVSICPSQSIPKGGPLFFQVSYISQ